MASIEEAPGRKEIDDGNKLRLSAITAKAVEFGDRYKSSSFIYKKIHPATKLGESFEDSPRLKVAADV